MNNKKWRKLGLIALAFVMVGALAFVAVEGRVSADEGEPEDPEAGFPFSGFGPGPNHPARDRAAQFMRYGREEYLQSIADQSGIALEDLQTALDERTPLRVVLSEEGFSEEEIDEMLLNAQYAIIDKAVEEGRITEEEAVERKARLEELDEARAGWQANREEYHELWLETISEKTGISVEELEAAQEEGTLHDVLAESMTEDEVQALIEETRQELVDQALAEGLITEEQAEAWLNRVNHRGLPEDFSEHMENYLGADWKGRLWQGFKSRIYRGNGVE